MSVGMQWYSEQGSCTSAGEMDLEDCEDRNFLADFLRVRSPPRGVSVSIAVEPFRTPLGIVVPSTNGQKTFPVSCDLQRPRCSEPLCKGSSPEGRGVLRYGLIPFRTVCSIPALELELEQGVIGGG